MRCMPWPTHGSGCGEERGAPEYLELARGGRGRGAGARRRRGAATTRASDRAGAAVLPPPDGGARRVRAHLLCDHRLRRTGRGTVPTVLPDRYRTPQPSALRPISPRHRPAQSDVWSRVVYGARVSLGIGAVAMLVAASVGTAVGAVAGYFRRWVDTTLMRLVDVGLAMPRIFVLLMAGALWEHIALWALVLLIGLTGWFGTSRLVRAEVLSLREREFVAAARALGAGAGRVIFRHVLPNAAAPIIVSAALGLGNIMLLEAGLSFLGMGVRSPTPSWGNMIGDGWHRIAVAWWSATFPGLAISLVVMALNAVGDALRDALDPRREAV